MEPKANCIHDQEIYPSFDMPFDIGPKTSDPARIWTFMDGQGRLLHANGLSLICNLEIL